MSHQEAALLRDFQCPALHKQVWITHKDKRF